MNEYVKLNMKEFGLNPLHYLSLPGYNFNCWLMSGGGSLDTLQDTQLLDDFVEAKRGGICGIMGDRIVNNSNGCRFKDDQRSVREPASQIWYIDANNLLGCAMMQKLPYMDFKFTTTSLDCILNTPDDSDHCYYIVCDVDYTNSCKDRTEQLALMPNKRKINNNELGYREREKSKTKTGKIILDQNIKTEYMVHYRMLKFYSKMGVKVTKIHRVIKFKQDYICRDYIKNNTNKRATAKSEAEKDVRKLMNNSLYGLMCMNPLHLLQIKFFQDEEKIMKSISEPTFKNITRYKDYSQIEYIKKQIEHGFPIYIGVTILELSKLHMYDVIYNIRQPSLKNLQLHYKDTDSFVLSYTEGKISDEHVDVSNLEPPIKTNNKVPGKFKHETESIIIEEFVALAPKTYSFKHYSDKTKEKGINNCNNAKHEEY